MGFARRYRKRGFVTIMGLLIVLSPAGAGQRSDAEGMAGDPIPEQAADADRARRIKWWQDARFGMFLCWTSSSQKQLGDDGWNIAWGKLSWEEYEAMARSFNPTGFDAAKIARQVKASGAKYVVFTAKHHGGFSLWDTKQTDLNIARSAYGKDVLKPLAEAIRGEGLRMGLYFSAWDWHRTEYTGVPREKPGLNQRRGGKSEAEGNPLWPKFIDFYLAQAEELLSNYGRIDVLWIDAWKRTDKKKWAADRLHALARKKQPHVLLNDRWADLERADFVTPENRIPERDIGRPWETCMRATGGWFYTQTPCRSLRTLIRLLISCVSRNGNLLLAFPLNAKGSFDPATVERMKEIGDWLKANGESIYGCGRSPLRVTPWGRATAKQGHIYLHVFDDHHDVSRPIALEDLLTQVNSANVLATGRKLQVQRRGDDVMVSFPDDFKIDPVATVIDVQLAGPAKFAPARFIRRWTVLSPIPGGRGSVLRKTIGPEYDLDAEKPLVLAGKSYPWTTIEAEAGGFVNLTKLAGKPMDKATFAAVDIICPESLYTELLFGSSNACRVILNGRTVFADLRGRRDGKCEPDETRKRVYLGEGRNTLVVKTYGWSTWGFYAWIGGGARFRLAPTRSMSFIGSDPDSWGRADAVVEAESAEKCQQADVRTGRRASGGKFLRVAPETKPQDCQFTASFTLPRDLGDARLLIRYGHVRDTAVSVAVDGGKGVRVELPNTSGWRNFNSAVAAVGALSRGRHKLRLRCLRPEAFHIDAVVFAEGTPVGTGLRVPAPPGK